MNMLAGRTRAVVATLMLLVPLLTACTHATKPVPPPVTLGFCGSNPQVMPGIVLVVCNTDDITARNLTWSDWGKPTATAKGSATVDLCAYEDCASGDYASVPIGITVSKIVHCPKNAWAYSILRYVFPNGSPFQGVPANVKTPGYSAGQDQPLPPANQTVSLTC
jgi:hypothetical protein